MCVCVFLLLITPQTFTPITLVICFNLSPRYLQLHYLKVH